MNKGDATNPDVRAVKPLNGTYHPGCSEELNARLHVYDLVSDRIKRGNCLAPKLLVHLDPGFLGMNARTAVCCAICSSLDNKGSGIIGKRIGTSENLQWCMSKNGLE
eukprot:6481420-Amphidinium_carterae.1